MPLTEWFRGPLKYRIEGLATRDAAINEWVDAGAVRRIADEHLTARREHPGMIWRLVVLNGWLRALAQGAIAGPQRVHDLLRRTIGAVRLPA